MNKHEGSYLSRDGRTMIHYTVWSPDGEPKGILQIAHGMVEFIGRYDRFASFMAENGWLVAGNDMLGHGRSVRTADDLGYFTQPGGLACVLADIHALRELLQARYPALPWFLLGHSMGSFLARSYITEHAAGMAGVIVMGTGSQPGAVLAAGKLLCRVIAVFRGWWYRSPLIHGMVLGGNNKRFEPTRTPNDWLTKDGAIVDRYNAEPWDNFRFTLNGFMTLFDAIGTAQDARKAAALPEGLPLLTVSGADDPVGGFGKGVEEAYARYTAAGLTDTLLKLYPGDRHEILNETDHALVDADILLWLEKHLPKLNTAPSV